ncbi:MAG TPA: cation transporter [Longimicrobiales bacterium]
MERVSLTISGMSCSHCVQAVDRALRSVAGVQVERVAVGSAVVAYDPAAVSAEAIREAVSEEGYEVREIGPVG